ncbi:MAG TPA: TM0106 family RecB-like putative nuclease [Solirubrobacterales bacterium]
MQVLDGLLVLSASDLNNYLACEHLTTLDMARARGEIGAPPDRGAEAELLAEKGDEHERRYLESLKAEGLEVVEIAMPEDGSRAALEAAAAQTEKALRAGPDVIYQATFFRPAGEGGAPGETSSAAAGALRGHADFLFRVEKPSALGSYSYEVADTKLARRAKPYFILQLCFYSELLAAVQGVEPERIHVILGNDEQRSFRLAEFSAYFRRVRDGFLAELGGADRDTYPEPVSHCSLCRWRTLCDERRVADDHLSLVAGISRRQRDLLRAAGFDTLAALGSARQLSARGIGVDVLERLHEQASLQLGARRTGEHAYLLLAPRQGRGFARLPRPSPGDVFFDMEGDPFFDGGGLEYLFGLLTSDGERPEFTAIWGRDRGEEKLALEQFVDFVTERRRRFPALHVYHYGVYEITALKRLAGAHGTREEELDQLLRDEVFVDLYKVVREAMRISQPSYSIKKVEAFYMDARETAVTDGGDSIVKFERWLEEGEGSILDEIAAYNEDDCLSTLRLRDWLLERRAEAEREFESSEEARWIEWFEAEPGERGEEALAIQEQNEALIAALLDGLPEDLAAADPAGRARRLAAQLLEYHHREARPVWWAMFDRMEAEPEALTEDPDCVAVILRDEETPPRQEKQSLVERLTFPPQETKMGPGTSAVDPADGGNPGAIVALDAGEGWLELKRGAKLRQRPLPEALIPGGPYRTDQQQGALRRLAASLVEEGAGPDGSYPAARGILRRDPPRLRDREPGAPIDHPGMELEERKEMVAALDGSHLFIQGPPGSGKTYTGARLIVDLIGRGQRVGVTSTSHKVIHNLLEEVEKVAAEGGVEFRGLKKSSAGNPESEFASERGLVDSVTDNAALNDPEARLTAGTAWHYCREDTEPLDYLFIDEAGQVSLADALALSTAARNVVLLGDPQQLPQVAQAAHPEGSSLSVLEHLLGERQTVDPAHGVFLEQTWRLHPDVCAFVSELMYDGRLRSAPGRERQRIDAEGELTGTGLRWLPVEHEGHSQSSEEEADRIAKAIEPLLNNATYTDDKDNQHPLEPSDILVVTPYNAQVKCLQDRLPPNIRIGTVDKFQGQEAQVAFFSMATSSSEEIPRNVEFLFSRNRLNVAISRARCLAVLVASPKLIDIKANSIEQMRLVNALCRFAEVAVGDGKEALT